MIPWYSGTALVCVVCCLSLGSSEASTKVTGDGDTWYWRGEAKDLVSRHTCVPGDIYCRSYSAVPEWAVASRAARKKEQLSILTSR